MITDKDMGRPLFYNPDLYLDAVEEMVKADEVHFALKMLENMPAFYRANPPERATKLKRDILKHTMTMFDYGLESSSIAVTDLSRDKRYYPRLSILKHFVRDLKNQGREVNIYEYCPGEYSVLSTLEEFKTGYAASDLKSSLSYRAPHPNGFNIFVCFEVIEHLWEPDITLEHWAAQNPADAVFVSTPYGTMGGGSDNWRTTKIGHVRTFTDKDLMNLCTKVWTKPYWYSVKSSMQLAIGSDIPIDIKCDEPLDL